MLSKRKDIAWLCLCVCQRSAIPGIGIEVLTPDPVLVLVLGIDLGLLAVLVLVLGIDLGHLAVLVLVLGIDHGFLAILMLAKSFVKNTHTCQGQKSSKNMTLLPWNVADITQS